MSKLMDKIKKGLTNNIPFMDGREKDELTMGVEYTINGYGFLTGKDGKFVVLSTKEDDTKFYFGGSVITSKMEQLETICTEEEIQEALKEGIKVKFDRKKSQENNNREYIAVEFI